MTTSNKLLKIYPKAILRKKKKLSKTLCRNRMTHKINCCKLSSLIYRIKLLIFKLKMKIISLKLNSKSWKAQAIKIKNLNLNLKWMKPILSKKRRWKDKNWKTKIWNQKRKKLRSKTQVMKNLTSMRKKILPF